MIELGKYSATVLVAWGVSLLLLGGIVVQSLMAAARARRSLEAEEAARKVKHG
ncbi:heme exporter protein CcmD [Paracoccus sp. S-4012]|uniref:heme exporter protein CcmD n=1 Tax=Paracoccus sp. S-4012 TaxID=2665648 RepID=UPI0012AF0892|nr:heme exporter protein CcmD [Paracoccus sp. S-4012]MRX49410.1 heme exporter protein CcmD [Paracoccus sp. S-4012]